MKRLLILMIAAAVLLWANLWGDMLHTIDGKVYEGKMVAFKYSTIYFNVYKFGKFYSSKRFPLYQVWKIEFNDPKKEKLLSPFEMEAKYKQFRRGKRVREVRLPADQKWTDTGINVAIGGEILFDTSGCIYIDEETKVFQVGELDLKWNSKKPMPNQPTGAVIARIGEKGKPFYVGDDKAPFQLSGKGRLYIGINDYTLEDNNGYFTVKIYY